MDDLIETAEVQPESWVSQHRALPAVGMVDGEAHPFVHLLLVAGPARYTFVSNADDIDQLALDLMEAAAQARLDAIARETGPQAE